MNEMHHYFHERIDRNEDVVLSSDRNFCRAIAIFCAVIGAFKMWHKMPLNHNGWLVVACIFMLLMLTKPSLIHPLNRFWMFIGLQMAKVTNPLMMIAVYYVVITPLGLLVRLFGSDLLSTKFKPSSATYWNTLTQRGPVTETMKQPF